MARTLLQDFSDDEVIGYYINLLKAISLKFTKTTVQFFFVWTDADDAATFPLYTESVKFIRHRDGMVGLVQNCYITVARHVINVATSWMSARS